MNLAIFDTLDQFSSLQWIILGIFVIALLCRFYYVFFFEARWLFTGRKEVIANEKAAEPISVLLTVRNEEENLSRILPQLLSINNVKYEAVVVDDYSLDNTYSILGSFRRKYSHLKISSLNEETRFSVKLAQNIALKAAQYDWVQLLPVDAEEVHNDWLSAFARNTTTKNRKVLIGYNNIKPVSGIYNLLYRIEMYKQQIQSAGFILNGIPFVYFEENVAFRRREYFNLGGYGSKTREPYANLELLINKFLKKKETAVLFNEPARLTREVKTDREDFFGLVRRSFRIVKHLSAWKRFFIRLDIFLRVTYLPIFIFALLFIRDLWMLSSTLVLLLLLAQMIIIKIGQNRLNERKIFIPSLVYGLLMPYYKLFYSWHFKRQSRSKNGR